MKFKHIDFILTSPDFNPEVALAHRHIVLLGIFGTDNQTATA